MASGDLNGDGIPEIVTAPGVGHAADFVVHDLVSNSNTSILNIVGDPDPMGGYQIAVGDVTGDGKSDLVTSTGPGVMNVIRVYVNESPQVGDAGYSGAVTLLRNQAKYPQIIPYFKTDPNFDGGRRQFQRRWHRRYRHRFRPKHAPQSDDAGERPRFG